MAWTNIPNEDVAVGALPFARTVRALRDNVPALASGDVGAPKINPIAAMSHGGAVGAVGTYALLKTTEEVDLNAGATRAGSGLNYANSAEFTFGTPSGTWRLMGIVRDGFGSSGQTSVWLRIS